MLDKSTYIVPHESSVLTSIKHSLALIYLTHSHELVNQDNPRCYAITFWLIVLYPRECYRCSENMAVSFMAD